MQFENARKYKSQVRRLYRSAFPANERAPLIMLLKRADTGRDSFYAITENGEFAGLVYTIESDKMVYVFFLAVEEQKRGCGLGAKILDKLRVMHPDKPVALEIEDMDETDAENYADRIRRLNFYKRNGFVQLGIKLNEFGVNYELLGTENGVTKDDFLALMKDYLGTVLFRLVYKKMKLK